MSKIYNQFERQQNLHPQTIKKKDFNEKKPNLKHLGLTEQEYTEMEIKYKKLKDHVQRNIFNNYNEWIRENLQKYKSLDLEQWETDSFRIWEVNRSDTELEQFAVRHDPKTIPRNFTLYPAKPNVGRDNIIKFIKYSSSDRVIQGSSNHWNNDFKDHVKKLASKTSMRNLLLFILNKYRYLSFICTVYFNNNAFSQNIAYIYFTHLIYNDFNEVDSFITLSYLYYDKSFQSFWSPSVKGVKTLQYMNYLFNPILIGVFFVKKNHMFKNFYNKKKLVPKYDDNGKLLKNVKMVMDDKSFKYSQQRFLTELSNYIVRHPAAWGNILMSFNMHGISIPVIRQYMDIVLKYGIWGHYIFWISFEILKEPYEFVFVDDERMDPVDIEAEGKFIFSEIPQFTGEEHNLLLQKIPNDELINTVHKIITDDMIFKSFDFWIKKCSMARAVALPETSGFSLNDLMNIKLTDEDKQKWPEIL